MIYIILIFTLIMQRSLGISYLVIPLLTVVLFDLPKEKLPQTSLIAGLLIDVFLGYQLGISSLLLLVFSLETSLYKSKIESGNLWSIFLLGLLLSVQAHVFWGTQEQVFTYFIHAGIAILMFIISKKTSKRGSKGIYLRK